MNSYANCTVFDIPLTWNRNRFEAARAKCRRARKLIEISVNVQFEKDLKQQHLQNMDVEKQIFECQETLVNHEKKVLIIENLIDVASESLPNYFDKRMEHVRRGVQEHCDAIQRLIREETEHWKEIHSAIDQNLVTAADFQVQQPNETEQDRIETIAEGDEDEQQEERQDEQEDEGEEEEEDDEEEHDLHENPSHYVNRSSVTSMLTQMIRKSQSRRRSEHTATTMEADSVAQSPAIRTKEERVTVRIPSIEFQFIRPGQDTTYFIKLEDQSTDRPSAMEYIPTENSVPLATSQTAASPIFSQPNPPARLYFSPTLLDEEPVEETTPNKKRKSILSPLDQNQIIEPVVAVNRLGQTFVLNNLKSEDNNRMEQRSSGNINHFVRPTITEEPCASIEPEPMITEAIELEQPSIPQESIAVEPKRTRRTRAATKTEPKMTRPTRNTQKSVEPTRRQTRKRKKSNSEETDPKSTTIALRKRRPMAIIDMQEKSDLMEKKPRKKREKKTTTDKKEVTTKRTKKKKELEIPIREPSPLPIIDRSKHYSMRFSTRSHRFNNFTLPMINTESDDDRQQKKSRSTRGRPTRKPKLDESIHDETTSKKTKKMTKQTRTRKTKKN